MNPWISLEEKTKRRDKLSIIAEIIEIAKEGALKTQVMYRANLSFAQLGEYLRFMSNADLLEKFNDNGREVYGATAKGLDFLARHGELVELINGCETGKNGVKIPHRLLVKKN
jgi:predicted transcriptional regulator